MQSVPDVRDIVMEAGLYLAIDAVVANVVLATDEPLRIRRLPFVELFPGLEERDSLGLLCPEVVEASAVAVGFGVCLLAELGAGRVAAAFDLQGLDGMAARRHFTHHASST